FPLVGLGLCLFAAGLAPTPRAAAAEVRVSHGLSLIGEPKYGPDFEHLDYVNPAAPKGGELRLYAIGGYDSLNREIIKGVAAGGLGLVFESLMTSPRDDVSAEYGLIAESIEVPDDLAWVAFNLRREARWHDGAPITADDVVFSFEMLKEKGRPFFRFYYANVTGAQALGAHKVRFTFSGPPNRELPHIMGQLPVLSKAYFADHDFTKTTLDPPMGSGPYRVKALDPGRSITYQRVADYWGRELAINRGRNNFDLVRYDYYRDQTVALEAFKSQEYDFRVETTAKVWATGYDFPALRQKLVFKEEVPDASPTGMGAFVFNLRRAKFQDRALRQALAYAFDFEWTNKNLFFGQYSRTKSYFSNSELASSGLPGAAELALLEPFRDKLPPEVFTKTYAPPESDGTGNIRANLRIALKLLRQAGWTIEDKKLVDPRSGVALEIEFLLVSPAFERVIAPFVRNLKRLGVTARIRTVDPAQYQNRLRDFDFDMVAAGFGQSESPGNEQRDYWSSEAAGREGSRNIIGIEDPVIDALIEKVIFAPDRQTLVTATRALDRVLLWGHYVIPQWYLRHERIAYWDKFGRSGTEPKYGTDLFAWWVDAEKVRALERRKSTPKN
ncbi:MAG: extracellular solute-binding protein, partial [Alphaproteobacteria bacterium]